MDAREDVNGVAVPIRLVAGGPAGGDPAIRMPPDGLRPEVPGGTGAETAPFAPDGTGDSAFEKNLSLLRIADSGQTFTMVAEPSACPDAYGPADADSD